MKAIVILIAVCALALGGVYYFQFKDFDPEKQAQNAKANVKPGMTLKKVIEIAGKNPTYSPINRYEEKVGKETVYDFRTGTPVVFDYKKVQQRINDGSVPWGFVLTYNYSQKTALAMTFDGDGKMTEMHEVPTMADMLQLR